MAHSDAHEPIPHYLGLPFQENALRTFSWRLALVILGLCWFGTDGLGATVMALPFLVTLPKLLAMATTQFIVERALDPSARKLHFFAIGPLVVRFGPWRIRWSRNVPLQFLGGFCSFRRTGTVPKVDAMLKTFMIGRVASLGFAIITMLMAFTYFLRNESSFVPALLTAIGFAGLVSFRRLKEAGKIYADVSDADHLHLTMQATTSRLAQAGRLFTLDDDEIDELIRVPVESELGLLSLYHAYLAQTSKGQFANAASTIIRAAQLADNYRRRPHVHSPELMTRIYQEAAYVASAYANDIDFAMRAMAIGGPDYISSCSFHKAMTAIYIRFGYRAAATEAFERARQDSFFWRENDSMTADELHLSDLNDVFRNQDLDSLAKQDIDEKTLESLDRPIFARFMRMPGTGSIAKTIFRGVSMLILAFWAWSVDAASVNARFDGLIIGAPIVFLLAFAERILTMQSRSTFELRNEGVLYHGPVASFWYPWNYVTEAKWKRGRRRIYALKVDRKRLKKEQNTKLVADWLVISQFPNIWPPQSLEQAIASKAPSLVITDNSLTETRYPA